MTIKAELGGVDVYSALVRTAAAALDFEHPPVIRMSLPAAVFEAAPTVSCQSGIRQRYCGVEAYLQRRRHRQWRNRGS
jgi:hypothetical protein